MAITTRILLVEDNEPLALMMEEFLRDEGLEVRVASSGHEALMAVGTFSPDIVLCDLRLPDMVGVEIAKEFRQHPVTKNALFVIHTAYGEMDIDDIDFPDIDLFVSKPLTPEKLDELLELSRRPHSERRSKHR
jgi:CheY-like chemotaxis protein